MRILDYGDLGILPLQHHEDGVLSGRRYQAAGVRLAKGPDIRDGASSDDGLLTIARVEGKGTIGDVHPVGYWQTKARDKRATGSWAPVFPTLVADVGPAAGQTTAGPSGPTMRPVEGGWVQDTRYSQKQGAWPPGLQRMPKNTMSLGLFGTDETEQRDLMATVDPRLFCPTTEGPADCGTLVVDLQGPGEPCMDDSNEPGVGGRAARLQSMMRVIPLDANSAGPIGVGPGNGLAWNLSSSRRDNLAGYGLVWGKADSGTILSTPITGGQGNPTTGGTYLPPPGFGQPGGGLSQPTTGPHPTILAAGLTGPAYGGPADTVGEGAVSVFSSGHFQPKPQAAHAAALMASLGGFGPLHVGNVNDKHRISVDRDGHAINAGHISTRAYFYADQQRDAPLEFSGFYPKPKQLPHQSRVFLTYDREAQHTFRGQAKEGMWRWYAETHVIVPSPPDEGDPPDDPQEPPLFPPTPEPPTTGGGGGPQPGGPAPPTTGGGGPTTGGGGTPGGGPGGPTTPGGGGQGGDTGPGGEGFPDTGQGGEGGAGAPTGPITGPHGGIPLGGADDPAPSDSSPGGGESADPTGPDEPDKPNPYGEEPQLQDGDEPVGKNDNPITDPTPIPRKEDGSIDHSKLKEWYPRQRRRVREWLRQMWNKHFRGEPWPDEEEDRRPDTTAVVGEMTPMHNGLFSIFHPMQEGFAAQVWRPQLMVPGAWNFEHNPNLGDLAELDELQRPQVLACRAWGAINDDGEWDYQRPPKASRARGGVANGGILFSPPCMELEDYAGMAGESMDTDAPLTTGYMAFAIGTCVAWGTPDFQTGGMSANSATIGQSSVGTRPVTISHTGRSNVSMPVATFDQLETNVPRFTAHGTSSMLIPRGTTAERPTDPQPHLRINSSGANDVVEFYDQLGATWTQLGTGGGGTWGSITGTLSSQTDLQTALNAKADDGDVTASGLTMSTARLLGRTTASTGAVEEIAVGSGLTLASGELSASYKVLDSESGYPVRSVSQTSDTSSADIYSFTIPANTIAAGKTVRLTMFANIVQSSGSDQLVWLNVKLGGTSMVRSSSSFANDGDPYGWKLYVEISYASTGNQMVEVKSDVAGAYSSSAGYGSWVAMNRKGYAWNAGTEDETTALDLDVRGYFGTTATGAQINVFKTLLEVLG